MDSLVTFTRPLGNTKTHVPQTRPENRKGRNSAQLLMELMVS